MVDLYQDAVATNWVKGLRGMGVFSNTMPESAYIGRNQTPNQIVARQSLSHGFLIEDVFGICFRCAFRDFI